jgi:hypothetical protein
MADHIPDPGKHRTLFYSHHANRARGARAKGKALLQDACAEAPKKRRCPPSWARLISKVYHADPLSCRECGGRLQIVAYINDHFTIKRILGYRLGGILGGGYRAPLGGGDCHRALRLSKEARDVRLMPPG